MAIDVNCILKTMKGLPLKQKLSCNLNHLKVGKSVWKRDGRTEVTDESDCYVIMRNLAGMEGLSKGNEHGDGMG